MAITENPTALVVETRDGRATLAGKRRLLDDLTEAAEVADEFDGQVFAIEPVEVTPPFSPIPAVRHVRVSDDLIAALPEMV